MDIHSNAISSAEENFPGDNMCHILEKFLHGLTLPAVCGLNDCDSIWKGCLEFKRADLRLAFNSVHGQLVESVHEGGDGVVSLEWLSVFVEECLNGGFTNQQPTTAINPPIITQQSKIPKPPSKMRTKRRKLGPQANNSMPTNSNFEDSTLLPQPYWLADSELILPKNGNATPKLAKEEEVEISKKEQPRRCRHCLSQKTPQWRAGPLGPKTLCNACGVRFFKSGRLRPEYRPAKSPTFEPCKHSNSHKKVMEMRMVIPSSRTN